MLSEGLVGERSLSSQFLKGYVDGVSLESADECASADSNGGNACEGRLTERQDCVCADGAHGCACARVLGNHGYARVHGTRDMQP